jgi:hypothetical protein
LKPIKNEKKKEVDKRIIWLYKVQTTATKLIYNQVIKLGVITQVNVYKQAAGSE